MELQPWNLEGHLDDDEAIAEYLNVAFEYGDPTLIAVMLGDVARIKGMTKIATDIGCSRESLYKSLSADGNPLLSTALKVLRAMGFRLQVTGAKTPELVEGSTSPGV